MDELKFLAKAYIKNIKTLALSQTSQDSLLEIERTLAESGNDHNKIIAAFENASGDEVFLALCKKFLAQIDNGRILPNELLVKIFKSLSSADLCSASLVAKHWNQLIKNTNELQQPCTNVEPLKIVMLNDRAVKQPHGQTALIDRLTKEKYSENLRTTIGIDFQHMQYKKNLSVNFFDNNTDYKLAKSCYELAALVVWCQDITRVESAALAAEKLKEIILLDKPILFVFTKSDLIKKTDAKAIANKIEAFVKEFKKIAQPKTTKISHIQCSAKTGEGIDQFWTEALKLSGYSILPQKQSANSKVVVSADNSKQTCFIM